MKKFHIRQELGVNFSSPVQQWTVKCRFGLACKKTLIKREETARLPTPGKAPEDHQWRWRL